jgi:transposase-like protein
MAAIVSYSAEYGTTIHISTCKYLNNIVELNHPGVKRVTRPMLGFHSFHAAHNTIVGIELMRMIKKGQMVGPEGSVLSAAEQFYTLAA